ncbi:ATP-binding protein [Peribacillus simplex]|uniref:sensor histidine kinase n=1 Tax=Peribacillus simplex TaxID=1478 RepID=UPI003672775B
MSNLPDKGKFRPRARILKTLGDELISSDLVAIIELIKNSYDADATIIYLKIVNPTDNDKGYIELVDNGNGMTIQTILNTWMEPATPYKKRNPRSEKFKRRVLGNKGIGRFASSRLAEELSIITRRVGSDQEVQVDFDWKKLDDDESYLDEIEIDWVLRQPKEIKPDGFFLQVWGDNNSVNQSLSQGTILRMTGTRASWDKKQLQQLRVSLSRLVSPFFNEDTDSSLGISIKLDLPDTLDIGNDYVGPPDLLDNPQYKLYGFVDSHGRYSVNIKTLKEKEEIDLSGDFEIGDRELRCGPFGIELRVWDRDPKSLNLLAEALNSTIKNVRDDLNSIAGISIYRDGFRVLPYGDPNTDWLRLDLRSRLNPTLRLANNQISGHITISADDNPELKDQSNREGIMDGEAFNDFKKTIKFFLKILEEKRYTVKRNDRLKLPEKEPEKLFDGFDLVSIKEHVQKQSTADKELIQMLNQKENDLIEKVKQVQEVISRYRKLSTLGQLIDVVLHEGRAPLAKIKNNASIALKNIKNSDDEISNNVTNKLKEIKNHSDVLRDVFKRIEPFGGRKKGVKKIYVMEEVIKETFEIFRSEIDLLQVKTTFPVSSTNVKIVKTEIQEVLINLIQNSLYWLANIPKENRAIVINLNRIHDGLEIIFSDSGQGISPENKESIFDPYFSTKVDGIGLGLAIAGEIITDNYSGKFELLEDGPLEGATFKVTLGGGILSE